MMGPYKIGQRVVHAHYGGDKLRGTITGIKTNETYPLLSHLYVLWDKAPQLGVCIDVPVISNPTAIRPLPLLDVIVEAVSS